MYNPEEQVSPEEQAKREMQANHSVESRRLEDFLEMNEETLRMIIDLYNAGELNEESAIALEALEALAES